MYNTRCIKSYIRPHDKNNSMIISELALLTVGIVTTGIGLLIAF